MASCDKECFNSYLYNYVGSLNEQDLDAIFAKHDKDDNGYIDANELEGFIKDIFSKELSAGEAKEFKAHLLERLDNNNDGKLDKAELKAILPTEQNFLLQFMNVGKKLCGVDFVKIWNHYDVNKNGILDGNELEGFLQDLIMKSRPHTVKDETFTKYVEFLKNSLLNKNGENKQGLDKADLFDFLHVEATCASFKGDSAAAFDEFFAEYDKDNNGVIEGDELPKLLSKLYLDCDETDVDDIKDVVLLKLDKNKDNKIQKSELKEFLNIQD